MGVKGRGRVGEGGREGGLSGEGASSSKGGEGAWNSGF